MSLALCKEYPITLPRIDIYLLYTQGYLEHLIDYGIPFRHLRPLAYNHYLASALNDPRVVTDRQHVPNDL